ncbi:MAG: PASTA domain-containing protein, partial [Gammaproteobacteria bacterium]|nr:PASTA domain-containing protein [Gammaproteobacteria bacterium]
MRTRTRTAFLLALALLFSVPSWAQIEQRCVLMVDRFQDPAELPQFHPVFDQALTADNLLSFDIDTSAPVSQAGLEFRLLKGPPGMTIDPATGVVTWAPNELQVGTISATVLVTDTDQRRNRHTFCVSVIDPNAAPLIAALADRTVLADEPVSFMVDASDPDPGDQLSFSLDAAPAGMSIQAGSGLVEWLPQAGAIGSAPVIVRASDDGGRFDTESFTITVVAENAPPVLAPIDDRGARPGVALQVQPFASDPDDPVLAWRLLAAPAGMTIDSVSGRIDWTPALPQLGAHLVSVKVADPLGFADTTDFEVLVDLNRPPIAVDDSGFRVERGDTLEVAAPGLLGNDYDPNSDPLSALLVDSPLHGTLTLFGDGGFDYTPDEPVGTIGLVETLSYERSNGASTWTPLIGNLDDDPQSELIIADGSGCCTGFLIAIDGITGLEEWVVTLPGRQLDRFSKPALADIDLDGRAEILVIGGEADNSPTAALRIYAFEHDGQLKWISEDLPDIFYMDGARRGNRQLSNAAITVADLDQDGLPEILVAPDFGPAGYHVFDHEGLTLHVVHEPGTTIADAAPTRVTVVDLDLDGDPEIVVGNVAWSHDGEMLWKRVDNFGHSWATTFPLVANLDDDPYPELVRTRGGLSSPGNIVAWNHDGTDLLTPAGDPWEVARPFGFNTAPISIADVDADGYADVLLPLPADVNVFEVLDGRDGSVKWSKSVTTRSMGATVFDMDRDGFAEVLFIDESSNLYVWDGRDGTEKLQLMMNNPRPDDHTMPVFADVDADGASELVVPGGFSFGFDTALSIWESPTDDWAPMRSIWNEHRYHVTNVNDDLTIPAQEQPHWLLPGLNQFMVNERLPEARIEESDSFTYRADDGELESNEATVEIVILPPNTPPRILSTPPELASPGFEYRYTVLAVDADPGESLAWSLAEGPAGMSVDALGTVSWTPAAGDLGTHAVVIEVADGAGARAFQNYLLEVLPPVTVPDVGLLSEAQAVTELAAVTLSASPILDTFSDAVPEGLVASQDPPA